MNKEQLNYFMAKTFGTYQVFTGPHICGEICGWIWCGNFYFDKERVNDTQRLT